MSVHIEVILERHTHTKQNQKNKQTKPIIIIYIIINIEDTAPNPRVRYIVLGQCGGLCSIPTFLERERERERERDAGQTMSKTNYAHLRRRCYVGSAVL